MIEDAINRLLALAPSANRDAVLEVKDGSHRLLLFDDAAGVYQPFDRVVIQTGTVSNIESFAALVLEEAERRGGDLGNPGEWMTVTFRDIPGGVSGGPQKGAVFSPDDRVRLDSFTYNRTLSQQWRALCAALGRPMPHLEFIRTLQGLRPSIPKYSELMTQFRKIAFGEQVNIVSEPVMLAGKTENTFGISMEAKAGGTLTQTSLPSEFHVELQYARNSEAVYPLTVELDLTTAAKGEKKELRFTLVAPDLVNLEQRAVTDEITKFRAAVSDLSRLLILEDL